MPKVLTPAQRQAIRERYLAGEDSLSISLDYPVSDRAIRRACYGLRRKVRRSTLPDHKVFALRQKGLTLAELAERFGSSTSGIYAALRRVRQEVQHE